jgi:hypothetical protein
MRTLIAGTAFVALTYLAQSVLVGFFWGPTAGIFYLISLPIAADINFSLSDRLRRAVQRARAFLRFRRDPGLQLRLSEELASLRDDVLAFDRALGGQRSTTTV